MGVFSKHPTLCGQQMFGAKKQRVSFMCDFMGAWQAKPYASFKAL
jgi:hypothetical protein